jgi:hypothetical protein
LKNPGNGPEALQWLLHWHLFQRLMDRGHRMRALPRRFLFPI